MSSRRVRVTCFTTKDHNYRTRKTCGDAYLHSNIHGGIIDLDFLLEITNRKYDIVLVDARGVFALSRRLFA